MLFIDLIEQRQSLPCISLTNSSRNNKQQLPHGPAYHALYGVHFSGQALCQVDGGGLIVVPIWLHNELRARHGVTNRSMSYYTSCGKVGAKQTAALPFLFGVSDLMILSLAHCHGAL